MNIGFGLYYHMLHDTYFKFAKQCGATHIVVHLTDYFYQGTQQDDNQPVGNNDGWGTGGSNPHVWEYEYLVALKETLARYDLQLEAIENFDPVDWYAVLLDLPQKHTQMDRLKQIIRNVGKASIPLFGYNFSLAGVSSRYIQDIARGGAKSVGMNSIDDSPIPKGMIWNMIYDRQALGTGYHPRIEQEELWERLTWFLNELVPVAEESNVCLAAHPDDPPVERVRQQPRLVHKAGQYQRLLDIKKSASNILECCLGTLQEMSDMRDRSGKQREIYYWIEHYVSQNAIGYIHFRNVKGKAPHYVETFIDEGDIDMRKILSILRQYNYNGILIPDHTPQMTCDAPWHAGMAYAVGYIKALLEA